MKPAIALSGADIRDKKIVIEACHGPKAKPSVEEVRKAAVTSLMPASVARRSGLKYVLIACRVTDTSFPLASRATIVLWLIIIF